MNALLMNRVDHVTVRDNNFSFNSGLGIGLYRVERQHDRAQRRRLQRARLQPRLLSTRPGLGRHPACTSRATTTSSRSIPPTHGGDGLFLWAGNYTMNTGQGGANDNVFYANDFSFAPANGMEATFSRNTFIANIAEGNDYGLWGGYSFESRIVGELFREQSVRASRSSTDRQNSIIGNRFVGDSTAIRLWGDSIQPSDWGYPKHRDTRSRDYLIERNSFVGTSRKFQLANSSGLRIDTVPRIPAQSSRWQFIRLRLRIRLQWYPVGAGGSRRSRTVAARTCQGRFRANPSSVATGQRSSWTSGVPTTTSTRSSGPPTARARFRCASSSTDRRARGRSSVAPAFRTFQPRQAGLATRSA